MSHTDCTLCAPGRTVEIYGLCDPLSGEVRYIGQAVSAVRRYDKHLWQRRIDKTYKGRWLRMLQRAGLVPTLRLIDIVPAAEKDVAERHYIALCRAAGCALTNTTDGGGGALGHQWSAESRAKQRAKRLAYLAAHPDAGRGDRNGQRIHPERTARGDQHWMRAHPERLAQVVAARKPRDPATIRRGATHHWNTHPEIRMKGERNPSAKLTWADVHAIRATYDPCHRVGRPTLSRLAQAYGVSITTIWHIVHHTSWPEADCPAATIEAPEAGQHAVIYQTPEPLERAELSESTVTVERAATMETPERP